MNTLKNNLAKELTDKKITQKKLAKDTNLSRVTISKLYKEKLDPKGSTMFIIAKYLGISIDKLFYVEIVAAIICISMLGIYIN